MFSDYEMKLKSEEKKSLMLLKGIVSRSAFEKISDLLIFIVLNNVVMHNIRLLIKRKKNY